MKLLITAATTLEIQPFLHHLDQHGQTTGPGQYHFAGCDITILIAGIGMMHTAYSLGRHLAAHKPHLAIQAGIAGTFRHDWELGSVVMVAREYLGDLGAEDQLQFKDLFDIELWQPSQPPFTGKSLVNTFAGLPYLPALQQVSSASVNLVSGHLPTIDRLVTKYAPDIESMEGAAFHYACLLENIPFLQLRSLSNYVEIRDKSKWKIPLAVKAINDELVRTVETLGSHTINH
ncbi:futalosine hydrolase [Chitinophaga nivalis]|uniref:Futalosine hydrolase n=1 Tax=Chitinophaga nivalis TaxID=2991709 RepID=A0ABT3ISQ7_9BACT|nr:futalosine hydrolase [Chitinophaga nivalis]MCW3463301.1 futalosine hydrolase [Chitinophaga nivalis]MCW3487009.1 futalosine hydrolase [Chitinophaga nivalis]